MSPATSSLPAGWSKILDEVHMRLDEAIASTDARLERSQSSGELRRDESHDEIAKWNERLQRLHGFLASADQVVQSVDESLQAEEARLRQQLAASTALRQKMSALASGAIG